MEYVAIRNNEDELMHYGVLGMKWGIRRRRIQDAKSNYKKATDKAFSDYEKKIHNIEKNYKRGQNLSKKDQDKEVEAENSYQKTVKQAKKDYNLAKKDRSNDVNIANKLYSKQNKEANKTIAKMSTGEAIIQSSLLGSYGALKYNEAKGKGVTTGKAAVQGVLYNWGDTLTGGTMSTVKYLDNRFAREN